MYKFSSIWLPSDAQEHLSSYHMTRLARWRRPMREWRAAPGSSGTGDKTRVAKSQTHTDTVPQRRWGEREGGLSRGPLGRPRCFPARPRRDRSRRRGLRHAPSLSLRLFAGCYGGRVCTVAIWPRDALSHLRRPFARSLSPGSLSAVVCSGLVWSSGSFAVMLLLVAGT